MTLSSQTLTLYEFFALVVSALGFVAVAVSLVFAMKQTAAAAQQSKYVADSLSSTNYAALANFMFTVERAFIDFPELRKYFYEGEPVDELNCDYQRILAVAGHKLGYFSYLLILSDRFPQLWPPNWWAKYIDEAFATSPVMRQYLRKNNDLFHPQLYDLMLKGESRSRSEPPGRLNRTGSSAS
jgi:hypothetical protein